MKPQKLYMVVYHDDDCLCLPMQRDSDCEGAICCRCGDNPVALFNSRPEARKAIRISTALWKLNREQGKPANDDFSPGFIMNVKIVPCELWPTGIPE